LCNVKRGTLLRFFGIKPVALPKIRNVKAVGFDIDDTLSFTSPAFVRGFATGGLPKPDDTLFWTHVNACDKGCAEESIILPNGTKKELPANVASTPKSLAVALVRRHLALGHRVYAITARPDINGEALREYIESEFGIVKADVYFEPEMDLPGNPAGKTDRIEALDLDVFYGDSDSDITDARKAFKGSNGLQRKQVDAIRFLRSPKSSNRKAGYLNKYHPGYFGEPILANSY